MDYNFREIEKKWRRYWQEHKTYEVPNSSPKPKYYVLDMFPYPSGAGLHVGHPLGYIASDIVSRYKRLQGFNVLHPMGYDAFGLPAEQYAIQTGQHPAVTTERNIARYREQLDQIGFSFDWSREVRTCDPKYFKWTQWAFLRIFDSWYDLDADKARPITELVRIFEEKGNATVRASQSQTETFTAAEWRGYAEARREEILLNYRLAYLADTMVNWCPALGTVLANDEVKEGVSVRGGHPVEQKKMKQWSLRITAYADRLLRGLDQLDWSESIKDVQRNWIGRSEGAEVDFHVKDRTDVIRIFTTRPDTIFGSTFLVVAPESDLAQTLTTADQKTAVEAYIAETKKRTERERLADVKRVTGVFTGSYAKHPFTGADLPIWISDYVLAGYGTGAIMAVPAHDTRDYAFAREFGLEIKEVIQGGDVTAEAYCEKEGTVVNSEFLNGLSVPEAIKRAVAEIDQRGLGERRINYRLRDAIFSRQRYWGEPIPVYYKDGLPYALDESELPLELPPVDSYLPTDAGDPPLGRAKNWTNRDGYPLELSTMPGFAGSSAYFLRYMDPHNDLGLVAPEAVRYWQNVDLYIGGNEHATGHLIYSRFWNMFLYDIGVAVTEEPFKKLVNQGMIQGRSNFVYRVKNSNTFVSAGLKDRYDTVALHVDVSLVRDDVLDVEAFKSWRADFKSAEFELEGGKYICGTAVEKMSKSLFNVVNPDDVVENYGADTLRLYEMFLGPLEQSKPWNTQGIEGVHRFLGKLWRLFYDRDQSLLTDAEPTEDELRVLHKTIKKVCEDCETFSFNTAVSTFMIAVNELGRLDSHKRAILKPLVVLLSPFAPHIAEELWHMALGETTTVCDAALPAYDERYLVESTFSYPVSVNGKLRFLLELPIDWDKAEIEKAVMAHENTEKALKGQPVKKVIVVPKKIINLVV